MLFADQQIDAGDGQDDGKQQDRRSGSIGRISAAVTVEHVQAHAGIDIGDVLIGMQLKAVAVPVRVSQKTIGDAHVVCAWRCQYV